MQKYDIFHALKEIGYFLTFCGSVYGAETISNIVLTKCAFRFNKMRISFFRYMHIVPATFFCNMQPCVRKRCRQHGILRGFADGDVSAEK